MTAPIVAHSFDPYHGDLNNRHPRLGAPVKRVVEREAWTDFRLTQPAIHTNGIFADLGRSGPIHQESDLPASREQRTIDRMIERSA